MYTKPLHWQWHCDHTGDLVFLLVAKSQRHRDAAQVDFLKVYNTLNYCASDCMGIVRTLHTQF